VENVVISARIVIAWVVKGKRLIEDGEESLDVIIVEYCNPDMTGGIAWKCVIDVSRVVLRLDCCDAEMYDRLVVGLWLVDCRCRISGVRRMRFGQYIVVSGTLEVGEMDVSRPTPPIVVFAFFATLVGHTVCSVVSAGEIVVGIRASFAHSVRV
jgi:hypothetical protein